MSGRVSKDEVGLLLAQVWSMRATCARRKVGCVLMDENGYELGTGYNGPAAGQPHCLDTGGLTDRRCAGADLPSGTGLDACEALHAEWNALVRCSDVRRIHTCYVTSSPCVTCTKMLLNTSCRRIVFLDEYTQPEAELMWLRDNRSWIKHGVVMKILDLRYSV